MLLIATDEAGYGPKLGPLVIAATVWRIKSQANDAALQRAFSPLARPVMVGGRAISVGDSKRVFQPESARRGRAKKSAAAGYARLQAVTLAGCRWCGLASDQMQLIPDLSATDSDSISEQPWFEQLMRESLVVSTEQALVDAWSTDDLQLVGMQTRVITAADFNRRIATGMNKSDLLSAITLELVRTQIEKHGRSRDEPMEVFCDRHGGRRYYAGPIQAAFDDTLVGVISETNRESWYRVPFAGGDFRIRFTVQGDSFVPVSFSSMVAKYLREKAMESLNDYFARLAGTAFELRPTAGYPVDADRFLSDVAVLLEREGIDVQRLVRQR